MSWIGIEYKTNEEMRACQDAKLWYWMMNNGGYPALLEVYGEYY